MLYSRPLTRLDVNENEANSLKFHYEDKIFDPVKSISKQFYELKISKKAMVSRAFRGVWIK